MLADEERDGFKWPRTPLAPAIFENKTPSSAEINYEIDLIMIRIETKAIRMCFCTTCRRNDRYSTTDVSLFTCISARNVLSYTCSRYGTG
ncbi:hypothetical protein BDDG_00272 [Blastomyces dermatitidis ATCC 18188]|uniref:Uncharacterized protein n=1 Tax=Ajellomyces dermatitidis (strain ATCC 18188 / CBS 674.68) TaxID=653446 RepID=F2T1K1_AJEDA|nr:hypothetical protein BDDG_00272 [Blastomyces dermatitidis ATCC 18188]